MGYEQSIASQINQLRDVLQRYHGFAVIRELLQNADDAGASRLDIGWVRSLAGAKHVLLSGGPACFVLNDGKFTASNARSIAQLGLSDKAGEHGRIGKFGLGLKSIHHLGEVYFYLSSSTFNGGTYKPNDVQNPWTARKEPIESFRPEWDGFAESDQGLIRKKLSTLLDDRDWFCLWVPLRRKNHVGDNHSAIVPEYPGDKDGPHHYIFPRDFEVEVARLIPLLKNLAEVRCWVESADGPLEAVSSLRIEPQSQRSSIDPSGGPRRRPLSGQVRVDRFQDSRPLSVRFTGFEVLLGDTRFGEMSECDDWPRPLTLPSSDAVPGRSLAKPEPAIAHAAACLVSWPSEGQQGRLDIVWASYLPVQYPEIPPSSLSSPLNITLTLHGRFFVDAGRVAIDFGEGEAPEAQTVRQKWNDLLRDEGTLDLVLPALQSFAESLAWEERAGVLKDLTSAILASSLFSTHRPSICRRHQWFYRLSGSGASWAIADSGSPACVIPEPAADEPSLEAVFPSLARLCDEGFCLTYSGWPGLLREDVRSAWPEWALLRLLDLDAAAVFADPKWLGLFVRSVEAAGGSLSSEAVAGCLREIARQGMASLKLASLMRHRDLIQRFLALIPAGSKLKIDLGSIPLDIAGRLIEPLWEEKLSVLVTPMGSGDASPTLEETESLLGRLLTVSPSGSEEIFFEHRAQIACQVVGLPRPRSSTPWGRLGMLPIFPVRVGNESLLELVGRDALTEALRTDRLFVDTFGLGGPLQGTLRHEPGQDFLTIARRTADAALGIDVVPECDPINCLKLLESAPPLVDAESSRGKFLRDLLAALGPTDFESDKQSLRYLLHASPGYFTNDATLFYESELRGSPIWGGTRCSFIAAVGGGMARGPARVGGPAERAAEGDAWRHLARPHWGRRIAPFGGAGGCRSDRSGGGRHPRPNRGVQAVRLRGYPGPADSPDERWPPRLDR